MNAPQGEVGDRSTRTLAVAVADRAKLSFRLGELLSDTRVGPAARALVLGLLVWMAFVLRRMLDFDGVLDIDVMNFGLAAIDFNVLAHQPHPPGYPGYVLYLELLHFMTPGLAPIDLAKLGALLCGVLIVPATYWTCLQVMADGSAGRHAYVHALAAAALAVVQPLLWYYGGHGQSHGAEALLVLLLFGTTARIRRAPTSGRLLLLVMAFGLAGSVRPTIALLSSPMLIWAFWGRPLRDWALALPTGIAAVAAWYGPLVLRSGGWELYSRASHALISDLFVANLSVFGSKSSLSSVLFNFEMTGYSALLALVPALAASRSFASGWVRTALAVIAVNLGFYALVFLCESGYLTAVAALACLAPATWPARPEKLTWVRAISVWALSLAFIFVGPARVPMPGTPGVIAPTYAHVAGVATVQKLYHDSVCGAAGGESLTYWAGG